MGDTSANTDQSHDERTRYDDILSYKYTQQVKDNFDSDALELISAKELGEFYNILQWTDKYKEEQPLEYQKLWTGNSNISEATHEFRLGEVDNGNLSLYQAVLSGADRVDTIAATHLRQKVADYILEYNDINDAFLYEARCKTRQEYVEKMKHGHICCGEPELKALASLYPNNLFCVISKIPINKTKSDIHIYKYVKDITLYKKCIFILHDGTTFHYNPLYLYNKINKEEEKNHFKYNDDTMRNLLRKFIRDALRYDGIVNFEDPSIVKQPVMKPNGASDIDDISSLIGDDSVMDIEQNLGTDENSSMIVTSQKPEASISSTNEVDDIVSSKTSEHIFELTHEFVRKPNAGRGDCLFLSLSNALQGLNSDTSHKNLRKQAADFIRQWKEFSDEVLFVETGQTRKEYCDKIENTNAWGGEAEIRAIAEIYKIIVCVVNVNAVDGIVASVDVTEFPADKPSFQKSCYIILQGEHYESLYLRNISNSNEEGTTFDRHNTSVKKLLVKFLQGKIQDDLVVRFNNKIINHEPGLESQVAYLDESVNPSDLTSMNTTKNLSKKRKSPEDDECSFMDGSTKKLSSSISTTNTDTMQSSTSSHPIPPHDQIRTYHKKGDVLMDIRAFIGTDPFPSLDPAVLHAMNQQHIEAPSIILSTDTNAFHSEQNQQQMKFETEPITEFRGRELSDYIPKSETKRDGTKSEQRKCSYFADMKNRHYFNLLIPTMLLFGDPHRVCAEVCMVTSIISGCIYIHPYFQFYIHGKNMQPFTINPFFIYLGYDKDYKLKEYQDNIQSLILHLPVIMLKNDELLQNQPIRLFQLLSSDGQVKTRKYKKVDTYKDAFHLNELHFAITLWIKESHDTEYRRRPDLRYISQVSTQNKNFKVSEWQRMN